MTNNAIKAFTKNYFAKAFFIKTTKTFFKGYLKEYSNSLQAPSFVFSGLLGWGSGKGFQKKSCVKVANVFLRLALSAFIFFIAGTQSFASPKGRPIVNNITAVAVNTSGSIKIAWELPDDSDTPITELCIYRDTKVIRNFDQVTKLSPIARLSRTAKNYTDKVADYFDYYYAVVSVTGDGYYKALISGVNAMLDAVHLSPPKPSTAIKSAAVESERESASLYRAAPLPIMTLMGIKPKKAVLMSAKAHEVALDLGRATSPALREVGKVKTVHIFEEDMATLNAGDDFLLFEILRTTFIAKKYKEAAEELIRFINSSRSADTTNRAVFYLAQCYYFSRDYKSAVHRFLLVYDVWPKLVKEYINSSLDLYKVKQGK